jgi:hypothetical protein
MSDDRLQSARLIAVAVLALLLFGFPFMAAFDTDHLVAGVPLLWAYLFSAWAVVIGLVAWVGRR